MTTILDRITITGIASAGLCAVAVALTPPAAAVPFVAGGGYACVENSAGAAVPAGAPCVAAVNQAAAPIAPPAGPLVPVVPVAPPPIIPPVAPVPPIVPPVPVAPVIPAAPIAAPAAGAPLLGMSGAAGKGDPVSAPAGTDGVPTPAGPRS